MHVMPDFLVLRDKTKTKNVTYEENKRLSEPDKL